MPTQYTDTVSRSHLGQTDALQSGEVAPPLLLPLWHLHMSKIVSNDGCRLQRCSEAEALVKHIIPADSGVPAHAGHSPAGPKKLSSAPTSTWGS